MFEQASPINVRLLTSHGMSAARTSLVESYPWFVHVKPMRYFEEIKFDGIRPRSQDCWHPEWLSESLGDRLADIRPIICLRPMGGSRDTADTTPNRGVWGFRMALSSDRLPEIVSLDWTFPGCFELAKLLGDGGETDCDAFCETARRRGSVIVYQSLPADALRVQTRNAATQQIDDWPAMIDTGIEDVLLVRA